MQPSIRKSRRHISKWKKNSGRINKKHNEKQIMLKNRDSLHENCEAVFFGPEQASVNVR